MALLKRGLSQVLQKSPSDIVFTSALRTPVTRAKKGGFKDTYAEELLSHILKATLDRNKIDPLLIEDVTIGTVLSELGGAKSGRMALLHAGFPVSTCFSTVNRQCSSGLQAIASVAAAIRTGQIAVGIAGGVESMTRNYGSKAIPVDLSPVLRDSPVKDARDCILAMGITSENVAERYGVTREEQDRFAVESQKKASEAQKAGKFDAEIVPMKTRWIDPEKPDAGPGTMTVALDDGVRHSASLEGLQKLKPAFKPDGTSTAGNSSQVSDGAAAALLMQRSTADTLGLRPLARFIATAIAGVRPDEMGIGPAVVIPKLLEQTGVKKEDVDIWEINEAFASQAVYCVRELGIEMEKVNPCGGAIALGHPLGATGGRQMATIIGEMGRRGKEDIVGVVSMCIGTGSGMASLVIGE